MFGLSLVDRLVADLALIEKDLGESGTGERAKSISELHAKLAVDRADLDAATSKLQAMVDRIEKEKSNQTKLEAQIRASGGSYARKREQLESSKAVSTADLTRLEDLIRQEAGGKLPFLLCSSLVSELSEDLSAHAKSESEAIASAVMKEKSETIRDAFSGKVLTKIDKSLSQQQRERLQSYVEGLLAQLTASKKQKASARAIDLSRTDLSKLETLISNIQGPVAASARKYALDLELHSRQALSAQEELEKAPSEEDLRPKFEEMKSISERLGTLAAERDNLSEVQRKAQASVRELESRLEKLAREAIKSSDLGLVFERSVAARDVAKKFGIQLTKRRLESLASEIMETYNVLSRKEGMIDHVTIDQRDFNIQLFTRLSGRMPKDRLSAGERQILAISILWALAKLSGRAMPMIVDTPLGRLDSEHRERLVHRYFTMASHQVVVLSTDEEVDEKFYKSLSPFLSRSYHLNYDVKKGCTEVSRGYFWSK